MSISSFNQLAMSVPAPKNNASVAENSSSQNGSDSLRNEFISLMVAQIKNQDPLNPMDGTEYVGQLAQFSQVESTENMSKMMQSSMAKLDNMQVLSTSNLIGRTVYVQTDTAELQSGQKLNGRLELSHASSQVNLLIQDQYGQVTKQPLGSHSAGDVDFSINPEELDLASGIYKIAVEVQEGQAAPAVHLAGEVSQVRIPTNGSTAHVNINGLGSVPFYQINQFGA